MSSKLNSACRSCDWYFLISDLSLFCWKIGIVKVKPIVPLVFSVPESILPESEYSIDVDKSSEGLLLSFSLAINKFIFWISLLSNSKEWFWF